MSQTTVGRAPGHTAGPWQIVAVDGGIVIAGRDIAEGVCAISDKRLNEADARLIAAAPEMLECLRDLLPLARWAATDVMDDTEQHTEWTEKTNRAHALLERLEADTK